MISIKHILIVLVLLLPMQANGYDRYNDVVRYDKYFSKYAKRYFGPDFDWRFFKAQAIAESRLRAEVQSKVGARGLMQIMPRTFKEIARKNPAIKGTWKQPRWNIAAGIYYDRMLWKFWKGERPFKDRVNFMFSSYNAGKGSILKAQKVAKKRGLHFNFWESIKETLPDVTGRSSGETIGYVKKIHQIRGILR